MSADLDKAIDRAVRDMLDVEPPADLRAKVIARIDERPASGFRLPASGFQRVAAVTGAAALLILAVVLVLARRTEPPAEPLFVANGTDTRLPALDRRTTTAAVTAKPADAQAPTPARVAHAASIDPASDAPNIDPLNTITPIEVAPIAQSSITPEPIGVRPLNPIPEMQIAPLNPSERRD